MKFKGDIIITDPCYIMKETSNAYPEEKDYFRYENPCDYPDAKLIEGINIIDVIALGGELAVKDVMHSDMYDEDNRKYEAAYQAYRQDDWERSDYGQNMEVLGINNYLTSDTMYGDWSCTTYEKDTNKVLGQFCADAGMVSVISLEEVLKYNPDFDYHTKKAWTTTLIKNFDGDVKIEIVKGEVRVIGTGNINFFTTQTGL